LTTTFSPITSATCGGGGGGEGLRSGGGERLRSGGERLRSGGERLRSGGERLRSGHGLSVGFGFLSSWFVFGWLGLYDCFACAL